MPRAKDFRDLARSRLKGHWGIAIGICLVATLLGGITGGYNLVQSLDESLANWNGNHYGFLYGGAAVLFALFSFAVFIIGSAVELGMHTFFCRTILGERPPFNTLFEKFHIFGKALGLRMFIALFIMLWSFLLVVPGIIAAYRYSMAPYLMAEYPQMGIREAVNRSKELMDGNKGRLFCLHLSFIGWNLLSILTVGILALWITPYEQAATAGFYLHLTGRIARPGAQSEQGSTPPPGDYTTQAL